MNKAAFLVILSLFTASAQAAVITIAPYPRNGEKATLDDWLDAAKSLGEINAKGMVTTKSWRDLDPANANYDTAQLVKDLDSNADDGREVLLGIQLINTVKRELPADLEGKKWGDPELVRRYGELLDHLAQSSPHPPKYVSIGNEVDIYLEQHPDEIEPYLAFYQQAANITRKKFPDAKIGITVTYEGLVKGRASIIAQLVGASDVAIFTYYPLIDLRIQPTDDVGSNLDSIVAAAQDKPVILQEVGFPTGESLGSSEAMQADFFAKVIAGIRERHQIAFASLFLLHDFSPALCDQLVGYYGVGGAPNEARRKFHDFLCTLGLKEIGGREKAAWKVVRDALKQ